MGEFNIDIIDIINNGGFVACLSPINREHFFQFCQKQTMKVANLYVATIGRFEIEIGLYKNKPDGYEIINLADDPEDFPEFAISDLHEIMNTTFNDLLQSSLIQSLPKHKENYTNNIDQVEICFESGTSVIYQDTDYSPAVISSDLTNLKL